MDCEACVKQPKPKFEVGQKVSAGTEVLRVFKVLSYMDGSHFYLVRHGCEQDKWFPEADLHAVPDSKKGKP